MTLTRMFTLAGLVLVLLALVPVMLGRFWDSIVMLSVVAVAGVFVTLRNVMR